MSVGAVPALRAMPEEEGPIPEEVTMVKESRSVVVARPAMRDWERTPADSPRVAGWWALGPREGADCPMDQSSGSDPIGHAQRTDGSADSHEDHE